MEEKDNINKWFLENARDFPWRKERTPYRVWISEVMLQQTRAAVVVPYFLRWMDLFPNVKALYNASLEQVIKAWEGLGYYSRARNLHMASSQIVEQFNGEIPDTEEALARIRGFGPYTVGAVLSFAFHKKALAIDGNVQRVITRYFCIEEKIGKIAVRRKIEEKTRVLLDEKAPWVTSEALIELGATVCTPKPRCEICPLKKGCLALKQGKAQYLPIKEEKKKITHLFRTVWVFENEGFVLLRKGCAGKVMADLYEFPYEETDDFLGEEVYEKQKLTERSHTFTQYKAHLSPYLLKVKTRKSVAGFEWISICFLRKLPFSSGHRQIASEIEKIYMDGYSRSN